MVALYFETEFLDFLPQKPVDIQQEKSFPKDDSSTTVHLTAFLSCKAGPTPVTQEVGKPAPKENTEEVVVAVTIMKTLRLFYGKIVLRMRKMPDCCLQLTLRTFLLPLPFPPSFPFSRFLFFSLNLPFCSNSIAEKKVSIVYFKETAIFYFMQRGKKVIIYILIN